MALRTPKHRRPTKPGDILLEEFLEPLNISQVELAKRLGIPFQRVNQIVGGKRAVSPDTALRLSKLFGTSVDFWLNLQLACDVYEAHNSPTAEDIKKIRTLDTKNSLRRVKGA
jgi:addiction module HigA family antidote